MGIFVFSARAQLTMQQISFDPIRVRFSELMLMQSDGLDNSRPGSELSVAYRWTLPSGKTRSRETPRCSLTKRHWFAHQEVKLERLSLQELSDCNLQFVLRLWEGRNKVVNIAS